MSQFEQPNYNEVLGAVAYLVQNRRLPGVAVPLFQQTGQLQKSWIPIVSQAIMHLRAQHQEPTVVIPGAPIATPQWAAEPLQKHVEVGGVDVSKLFNPDGRLFDPQSGSALGYPQLTQMQQFPGGYKTKNPQPKGPPRTNGPTGPQAWAYPPSVTREAIRAQWSNKAPHQQAQPTPRVAPSPPRGRIIPATSIPSAPRPQPGASRFARRSLR